MKTRVLQPFIMGNGSYQKDQIVDLLEDQVQRLVGSGLVEVMREDPPQQPSEPIPTPAASIPDAGAPAPVSTPKSSKKKKK